MAEQSFYDVNIEKLIDQLKLSIPILLDIVGNDISSDIKDDKLLNVLKAKKLATEDIEYTLKKIEELEKRLLGEDEVDENENYAQKRAKLKNAKP
jgi:hypothetical protein